MPPEPDPNENSAQPNLSDKIADLLISFLSKGGGVAGGGIGAFWLLFKESDIPRAVASAVIGLGITYGATLLKPLHQGTNNRLDQAGKRLNQKIDRFTSRITGFDDRYLERQASACEGDRPDIPRDPIGSDYQQKTITALLLENVFVPLTLDLRSRPPGYDAQNLDRLAFAEEPDRDITPDCPPLYKGLDIWDFLAKVKQDSRSRQLAILAWGGYGKTTLLKHIAYCYGKKQTPKPVPNLIPVLLILRKYRDLLAGPNPPDLPDLMTTHHLPSLPDTDDVPPPEHWARDLLRHGRALIMLDGFDEVSKAQRPALTRWLNAQLERYPKSVFILTSRPRAYTEQGATEHIEFATSLWIRDFDQDQRRQFVQQWYRWQEVYASRRDTPEVRQVATQAANELLEQIKDRSELQALAKNPLLLNMIVTFHWRNPGAKLPNRRVDLYREICHLQLKHRPGARQLETLLTQCDAKPVLQRLALGMMQRHQERIERTEILRQLKQCLKQERETIPAEEFLEQVEQISELLVRRDTDEYEFAHLSFQEYLAATHIAQHQQEQLLYDHLSNDWWKQTILLYAAQTKTPSTLIRVMLEQKTIDLAYACLQDTTKQIDPELVAELDSLKQSVQSSRYQQLEDHLKHQRWKEADRETYRLMITAVGKEEGQYFEPEELLNFPCEDLLAIDSLWVTHSKGRFGFSVQKEIYLECGGIPDGKYHKEAFEKFGDRIGWRENGSWKFNVIFDTSAPIGHLPRGENGFQRRVLGSFVRRCSNFFSRIAHCKL